MNELVIDLLSKTWYYYPAAEQLVLNLGTSEMLQEESVVTEGNYLDPDFKEECIECLGSELLEGLVGPFGDADFFSGVDNSDGSTTYFIKLCNASEKTKNQLLTHPKFNARVEDIM